MSEDGQLDGIMCEKGGNFCASDQWCTGRWNEKQSRWSHGTYKGDENCYSTGMR